MQTLHFNLAQAPTEQSCSCWHHGHGGNLPSSAGTGCAECDTPGVPSLPPLAWWRAEAPELGLGSLHPGPEAAQPGMPSVELTRLMARGSRARGTAQPKLPLPKMGQGRAGLYVRQNPLTHLEEIQNPLLLLQVWESQAYRKT